ncbi:MAG: response regulator transcription factor [Peptococcaceae bacterium]|nr:response regulator transcription factor [Peptococcaceae bacterium]
MTRKKILVIEDEAKIARFVQLELEHEGYAVQLEQDGRSGLEKALSGDYDLIILDVMLPSLNGMEVLRRLRQSSEVPVIMLTAKGDIMDRVMGLDSGADDYMVKPFAIEELLARIRTAFKRNTTSPAKQEIIRTGRLCLDVRKRTATYDGEQLGLTKTEFDLLKYLMQNKEIVLTRDTILEEVWGYDYAGETNIVDVYIRYLRSKIDDRYNTRFIHTVRGVGYQLKNEE